MLGGIGMNNKAEYTPEKVVDISNLSRAVSYTHLTLPTT